MECNKDEAIRAKEIAQKKFDTKDFEGAKKFALKAQNLYPGLEGVSQMLATFDVYICASSKINGEADWYSILGINPSADDETVKKHYKKLALILHPDKNKSIGADGAFSLISEALCVLSDKSKRAIYDQRRSSILFSQRKPPSNQVRQQPAAANGFNDFAKSNVSRANNLSSSGKAQNEKPDTFWTLCYPCKMQYEYLREYCNYYLLCPNCGNLFLALEMPAPGAYGFKLRIPDFKYVSKMNILNRFCDPNNATISRWTPMLQSDASNAVRSASAAQKTYEKAVREFEEALAAEKQDKGMKRKYVASSTNHINSAKKRKEVGKPRGVANLSQTEICGILADKARKLIHEKISTQGVNNMLNGAISQ